MTLNEKEISRIIEEIKSMTFEELRDFNVRSKLIELRVLLDDINKLLRPSVQPIKIRSKK